MSFDYSVLKKAVEMKRKKREKLRRETIERVFKVLDLLSERYGFEEAYIFGSLARPYRFREDSDVDIAFIGLKDEDFFRLMADLSEMVGRDVDVIQMERCGFSWLIEKEGIRWKRKSSRG